MQSDPSKNSQRGLSNRLAMVISLVILVPIGYFTLKLVSNAYIQGRQAYLVDENFTNVKVGMTSDEVEQMLGWPDAIYLNADDPSIHLPRSLTSRLRFYYAFTGKQVDIKKAPVNTGGREVWIYEDGYPHVPRPGVPAIIFNVKTGRVTQLTKVYYSGP